MPWCLLDFFFKMHVLILGAGPGGLTVAQCLRKQGISYEIFDRDESEDARFQGWAIGMHTYVYTENEETADPILK